MTALLGALLIAAAPGAKLTPPTSLETHLPEDGHAQRPVRYVPAILETGLIIGVGTVWYWTAVAPHGDWDMHFDWSSWKKKLNLEAVRFDSDRFQTNTGGHPLGGMGYYQAARGNGMSVAASYLWAFTASLLWEYFIEFNEHPSINDIVMTPAAGTVLGESTYRLGRFFDAGAPTLVNRTGALLFSPFAVIDDMATGRRHEGDGAYDAFGLTRNIHHRLALTVDQLACFLEGRRVDQTGIAFQSAIVSHGRYRRPGRGTAAVGPGQWTELSARVLVSQRNGQQGVAVHSSTVFVGRYRRSYAERDESAPRRADTARGWGAMLGLGSGFDLQTRDLDPLWDRVASVGLIGPTAELRAERGGVGLRLSLASHYSFALVQSLAFAADGGALSDVRINTALRGQGYYYAHGVTSAGTLAVSLGQIELSVEATLGAFWSIQGRDRYQERLQVQPTMSDLRSSGVATAGVRPFGGPVLIAGRFERYERVSHIDGATASTPETRAGVGAGMVF